ncbi:GIY-YIG nuclease family protein [Sinomicrobium kalidii]|uniref:GIY-YIG nuclease family protein n=1 Tax=Sinomicrobium kalidii TaxID=2900738 RepID=UPI001E5C07EC|nr:GIY-YIG nuclease family protein [Sinomicrobium kalidii]UGU17740.1 GIY-YIG nuclease family protein [Sinomicrobium kalidii]
MEFPKTRNYCVYILTNRKRTVLYTGVTNNLKKRLHFHRNPGYGSKAFTARYRCFYLIYWEHIKSISKAIKREKELKGWRRAKKEALIRTFNPEWKFLNDEIN